VRIIFVAPFARQLAAAMERSGDLPPDATIRCVWRYQGSDLAAKLDVIYDSQLFF